MLIFVLGTARDIIAWFDSDDLYRGDDTINPYRDYRGPKPAYQKSTPDTRDSAFLNPTSSTNGIELASNTEGQSTNTKMGTDFPIGVTEGLTTANSIGVASTNNDENLPPSNLNEIPTSNAGLQPNNLQRLASSDLGLLSASNKNDLVLNDYYGTIGNEDLVIPATSNSNPPSPGTLPVRWRA